MTAELVITTVLILGLGAVLRGYRITARGLIFWDDGERALQALSMARYFHHLLKRPPKTAAPALPRYPFDANPLSMVFNALAGGVMRSFITGPLLVNVMFGLAGVAGVQALATALFGAKAGLVAACVLAVSGYHVVYSRSFHAEVTCGAFSIWALLFYWRSFANEEMASLAIAGLLVAMAFLCNSRQVFIPLIFAGYESVYPLVTGTGLSWGRIVVLGVAVTVPLLLTEGAYRLLRLSEYPGPTYFRQLAGMVKFGEAPLDLRLPSLKIFVRAFSELEGPTALLMAVAAVWLLLQWSAPAFLLLPPVLVPLVFWSLRPTRSDAARPSYVYAMPRFVSPTIYPLAIATGALLSGWPDYALYPTLAVVLGGGIYRCRHFWRMSSGYAAVSKYLLAHGAARHLSFCPPNTGFYVGAYQDVATLTFAVRNRETALREQIGSGGCRYVVYSPAIHRNTKFDIGEELAAAIASSESVLTTPLGMPPLQALYWDEHNNPDAQVLQDNVVSVYDLASVPSLWNAVTAAFALVGESAEDE